MHKQTTLSLCIALAISSSAFAAETTKLEEIKITTNNVAGSENSNIYIVPESAMATHLPLSIKETPQAVSVVTHQQLKDRQLTSVSKVLAAVPGVSVKQVDRGRYSFSSRGFAINKYQIDGMSANWNAQYTAGDTMGDTVLYDRVEVIRGATGLTTGSGNPSAAVNFVRKHADSAARKTSLGASIGTYGDWDITLDHGQALNESGSVRGRVIAQYKDLHSQIEREKGNASTIYATIDADITDKTLLRLGVTHEKSDRDAVQWGGFPAFAKDGGEMSYPRSRNLTPDWSYWNSDSMSYFAELTHHFNEDWKASLKAQHRKADGKSFLFYPWGEPDRTTGLGWNYGMGKYDTYLKQTDVQLDLNGKFEAWGLKHDILFGLSYNYEDRYSYGAYVSGAERLNIYTFDGSIPAPTINQSLSYGQKSIEKAIYGATRLNITEKLHLILGSRLSNWQRNVFQFATNDYKKYHLSSQWTPYAGLLYDITPNHTVYASYTDVFNPQTYYDMDGNLLDPVVGSNYELGWKGNFIDNLLQTQVSVFQIRQDNLAQSTGQRSPVTGEFAYTAAKGAKVNGFDIEIIGQLTDNWQLSASYTYWQGKDAKRSPINTNHPKKQFKLFTTYKLDQFVNGLTIGGGINWQSKTYQGKNVQHSYATVDLMAAYQINKNLSAQINVDNVFNKKYKTQLSAGQLGYGDPAHATLSVNYTF